MLGPWTRPKAPSVQSKESLRRAGQHLDAVGQMLRKQVSRVETSARAMRMPHAAKSVRHRRAHGRSSRGQAARAAAPQSARTPSAASRQARWTPSTVTRDPPRESPWPRPPS